MATKINNSADAATNGDERVTFEGGRRPRCLRAGFAMGGPALVADAAELLRVRRSSRTSVHVGTGPVAADQVAPGGSGGGRT